MDLKNQKITRQLQADVQQENSQVVFSFASEVPYLRQSEVGQYYEILKCQPQYVDTSRLEDGACQLLLDHDWQRSIGVCKKYWFADKKLYASIKFSRSNFAQGIKRDVLDQIRKNVSIGYIVKDYQVVEAIDGIKTIEVTDWQPYELTICSVPADPTVGFQRSLDDSTEDTNEGKETQMKNAKNNKTDSTRSTEQEELAVEKTDVDLEDKNLDGEDLEGKSEEATEVEEKTKEKEVCPECGKDPCQCEKSTEETDIEEKNCGGQKPQEKSLDTKLSEAVADPQLAQQHLEPTAEDLKVAMKKEFEQIKAMIYPDAAEIKSLGELVGEVEVAKQFVAEHKSLNQFKTYLKNKDSEKSKNSIQDNTKMEKKYFSVSKLINAINNNTVDTESYEFKTNSENKKSLGVDNQRAVVLTKEDLIFNANTRAFSGTVNGVGFANGGDTLIQTLYRPDMYAENLRPQLTLEKTGYFDVSSPDGRPIEWPVCTGGVQAGIVDLDGNLPSADMQWKTVKLYGKKIGAIAYIPYSLLTQSAPKADEKIEADLVKALYQVRDTMAFTGRGYSAESGYCEPIGILNNANVNQYAITGAFTWKDMLEAENLIRESNDFSDNLAWVMNGKTYVELCSTGKNPAASGFVYGFICEDDKIKKFPVYVNNAIPDNKVILGNFNELVLCDFEGLMILPDPYTNLQNNLVRIAGWMQADCTLQRPKSFTVITRTPAA